MYADLSRHMKRSKTFGIQEEFIVLPNFVVLQNEQIHSPLCSKLELCDVQWHIMLKSNHDWSIDIFLIDELFERRSTTT